VKSANVISRPTTTAFSKQQLLLYADQLQVQKNIVNSTRKRKEEDEA